MPRNNRGWKVWVERGGDNWRCRWLDNGVRGQKTFALKDDAYEFEEKKRRVFARRDSGLPAIIERSGVRVSAWSSEYLLLRSKNPRINTYRNDCDSVNQFKDWVIGKHGDTDLDSLTEADVYLFKDWLYENKGYSNATVRNRLGHLKPAIKWAKRRGMVNLNFALDVEMPKPSNRGRVLTLDEIKILYGVPPRYVMLAFAALLNSGMRKGEVVSLLKKQVEKLDPPELWRIHFDPIQTKNGKPKAIVLNPVGKSIVVEAMELSPSDKVFDGVIKGVLDYWMRRVQDKLGAVRLHDLKHTFCTYWMRATGDIYGLQQMTGNSLNSLRIYNHLSLGTPRGLIDFQGFAPIWPLNAIEGSIIKTQKDQQK